MKKRSIALLLIIFLILSSVPAAAADLPTDTAAEAVTEAPTAQEETAAPATEDPLPERPQASLAATGETASPDVTAVVPSVNGVSVSWNAYASAAQYVVFIKKAGKWTRLGVSKTTSYEHRFTPNGSAYIYAVRAVDKNGKYIGALGKSYSFACLPSPTLKSVKNVYDGQKITWKAVKDAPAYKVYIRSSGSWKPIGETEKTSYRVKGGVSGKKYTYTVRCWNSKNSYARSYFSRKGVSATFIAAPQISGFKPVKGGIRVSWKAVKGASRYAVYIKSGSKWKTVGFTKKISYDHTGLTKDNFYTYSVGCVDKNGNSVSGADPTGKLFRYVAAPKITSLNNDVLTWKEDSPATRYYRVYRKTFGKDWTAIATVTETSFTDTAAPQNTVYSYTVRCLDADKKNLSYFAANDLYYYNGALANGTIKVGGTSIFFDNGKPRRGYVTIGGKTYYYNSKGVLQKNGIVGTKKEGYRYADKNGVVKKNFTGVAKDSSGKQWYLKNGKLDKTLRIAVTVGGVDYDVIDGRAHKVKTEEERTLFRAFKLADRVASRKYSKAKRLKILFYYIRDAYVEKNPRIPHYHGKNWHVIYANDMLVNGVGNCMSYGAELAFLAKAIGYDEVYACNSGGHGWAEIDGLIYDPEWSRHRFNYTYFALSYNAKTDQNYRAAISAGYWWMRVKVCANL